MNILKNYIKNNRNVIIGIIVLIVFLLLLTVFYQNVIKRQLYGTEILYENKLAKLISTHDIESVDYNFLNSDLNSIDGILKEQISFEMDKSKKETYYSIAEKIYTEKMHEYISILNTKLDDEDFEILQLDIDEFEINLDFAIEDMENNLESTFDIRFYTNRYLYEEKQKKCREILETYKGFLQ